MRSRRWRSRAPFTAARMSCCHLRKVASAGALRERSPFLERYGAGSTNLALTMVEKCKWAPVDRPVMPT